MKLTARRDKGPNGAFTLVELLVVIAVIGLLASILVPTLYRAKGLSRSTICKANQHSIHQAATLRTNDRECAAAFWWFAEGTDDSPTSGLKDDGTMIGRGANAPGNIALALVQDWDGAYGDAPVNPKLPGKYLPDAKSLFCPAIDVDFDKYYRLLPSGDGTMSSTYGWFGDHVPFMDDIPQRRSSASMANWENYGRNSIRQIGPYSRGLILMDWWMDSPLFNGISVFWHYNALMEDGSVQDPGKESGKPAGNDDEARMWVSPDYAAMRR
ncbi:MAG: type II secretion system protein [Planctomycetes bacterium]|nr:type II secretion system protein [Planctomycetota bacterium]